MTEPANTKPSPWPRRVVAAAAGIALALGGYWAGRVTMTPAATPSELPSSAVTVQVLEQTVGRTMLLNVQVSRPDAPAATNRLAGVVTRVAASGTFEMGNVLYEVDGVPVRVIAGTYPMFRDLTVGVAGPDVRELRDALVVMGLATESGDQFTQATATQVQAWQRALGIAQTGTITAGELVMVPAIPISLALDADVLRPGTLLHGGETVVAAPTGDPTFTITLMSDQARLVPDTATVHITYQGHEWTAGIGASAVDNLGQTVLTLIAPDGGNVCGADCTMFPTGRTVNIPSPVTIVEPATGPAVPVAAVVSNPDRSTSVTVVSSTGAEEQRRVEVLGSQDGLAVVSGVEVGERVQVIGGSTQPGAPASSSAPDTPTTTPESPSAGPS